MIVYNGGVCQAFCPVTASHNAEKPFLVAACTIIARNYLAHARVLADSFFLHHPDGELTVLLIDDEAREFDGTREAFRCLRLSDIGLDRAEIGRLAAIYDVTELATAVKPPFLRQLLSAGQADIIYLDPDIRIFGSLEPLSRLAREHSIVLTPHTTVPVPHDGQRIDAFQILASGIYNLGFIALGPRCEPFLDWWWQRTRREARSDPTRMMFTDQRWVDFVPSFFEHFILKDPAYNVAYWNLHARHLTCENGRYLVDGHPLRFFHFSGYDGRSPHLLSKHQGDRPRILLSEHPAVARICREYLASLEQAGLSLQSALPYGWNALPSGLPLTRDMRRVYREGLEAHEHKGAPEPPNPFVASDVERFLDWLNEPVAGGLRPQVSRYLYAIYQSRVDLQLAFPDLAGADGPRYLEWVRHEGVVEQKIPAQFLPREPRVVGQTRYATVATLTEGVNIVGYFQAEVGVGEAARLLTSAVDAGGIPHSTLTYNATPSRKSHPFVERGDGRAPYDINIVCVNADQTPTFAKEAGPDFLNGRHTVGYWFWELEHFPPAMYGAFDCVDEVWAATRFVTGGIQAPNRKPVHTVPLPIPVPRCSPDVTRNSLRLPLGFMFLFAFDFFSVLERKNPVGLISAFERAFQAGEGPTLVLKTINGDAKPNDLEKLRAAAARRPDVLIVDDYYSVEEKNSLLGLCDCYVSLHRSEGLGLTMAEAMGLGKPVIATGYSGNLDFMTEGNSYLVDYVKGAVPAGCDPYPEGTPWAEPNLDQAAEYMRQVYEGREAAARKARQAREDILTKHNVRVSAAMLHRRLDAIRHDRVAMGVGLPSTEVPSLTSLDQIASLLTPTPDVAPGRRFRRPLMFAQRLLFKILRPYWWQQRQIQMGLMHALRASTVRAADAERHQGQVLESLRTAVYGIEGGSNRLEAERQHRLALEESIATFQASAAAHLKALTDQLATTTAQASTLSTRLYAAPYMAEDVRFHHTDTHGRLVLGFRSKRAAEGDGYLGFEDVFRGTEAFIRDRLRTYLPLLQTRERVIEIGCGRGELLDLLNEAGVPAIGVDIDEAMVRRCRAKGHTVEHTDANSYLRAQADSSMPAIFAAQVVEHLPYEDLISFLQLSRAKLQSGGQLIFETVNPHALEAFKTFWTDLTHQRPIFPEVALVWCWLVGFEQAHVLFPNGVGDLEQDRMSQGEYCVVATKGGNA
jgi:glycosyltransferase involved in cell wall biosynthesis/2-polyprenyl-3-methyl-5-hydroxy-6-metoxy-1,4-benzoquinol methylase